MIPKKAIDLILTFEGVDQPSKWPGGESGITIGVGYDLGYEKNFAADWEGQLPASQIDTLKTAIGKTGNAARKIAPAFRGITITTAAALSVFERVTLPHYEEETLHAFPGADRLPALAFGALVSLVFNRGSGMAGSRRAEMRAIRAFVALFSKDPAEKYLKGIANEFRGMRRLWVGQGLDGLLRRREAEAELVESTIS